MARGRGRSAASRVFAALVGAVALIAVVVAALLALEAQRTSRAEAERVTQAVAHTLADSAEVVAAMSTARVVDGDLSAASAELQPLAVDVMADARVDFVTIMDLRGIRVTHRDPAEIGRPFVGTIPATPVALTEQSTGTLGPSLRTIVPISGDAGQVGWVAVGVTIDTLSVAIVPRLLTAVAIGAALIAAGVVGALVARRVTRRVAGDLPAGAIRDTLASAESMRTLGEALRAQTHEHGNRMHTAVALLELGRTAEAVGILTDSARQSQALVDQVSARVDGDPTVGALLLGKASQAAERGIEWIAEIAPDAPRSAVSAIDAVALVGNLIDNALDAAGAGDPPRWVRVTMSRTPDDEFSMTVSDSGAGIPDDLRERVFERGFTTKPAGADGRGVGLALVRAVVDDVGGSLVLDPGPPTTFRIVLPTEAP